MNNAEMPAMPVTDESGMPFNMGSLPNGMPMLSRGLTKREAFAALAMQGFCAAPEFASTDVDGLAEAAVRQADALLAELEQPND